MARLGIAFKIIISMALLGQKSTSPDLQPLQGHFGSQVIIWVLAVVLQYEEHLLAAISG